MKIPLGAALLTTFMSRISPQQNSICDSPLKGGIFSACNPYGDSQRDRIPVSVESIKDQFGYLLKKTNKKQGGKKFFFPCSMCIVALFFSHQVELFWFDIEKKMFL